MFRTKVVTNITTHILGSTVPFFIMEKYCTAGQATDDTQYTMAHVLFM